MTRPRDAQFWAYVEACLDNDMTYSEALNMAEWDLWDRVEPDFTDPPLTVADAREVMAGLTEALPDPLRRVA